MLWFLVAVAGLIVTILVVAALKPKTFRVERSASIAAPPERIYPQIADFHRWPAWSPWEKLDPTMQRTFEGADSGQGAIYRWTGNKKVGSGRMEITDAVASSKVSIKLDFFKPFEAHNQTTFTLTPSTAVTNVTWSMDGSSPFMFRVMSVFMNIDKMVGRDFEKGLANLAEVVQ